MEKKLKAFVHTSSSLNVTEDVSYLEPAEQVISLDLCHASIVLLYMRLFKLMIIHISLFMYLYIYMYQVQRVYAHSGSESSVIVRGPHLGSDQPPHGGFYPC